MEASDNDIDNEEVVWGRELEGDVEELYSALLSLRKHLTVAPPQQARAALNTLQLAQLFNCLDTADNEQVTTACEVLEMCFSNLSIDFVAKEATENILKSLHHSNSTVRLMAVNEIYREVKANNSLYSLPDYLNIAIAVIKCICDQELKVATKAIEVISMKDWLKHPQIINEIKRILDDNNASNSCKCYEVVLNIVKESPNRLKDQEIQTFLYRLLGELKTDDILMQLNILELLSNLAITPHGLNFLIENDVLKQLSEMVKALEGNQLSNLVIPGLMKFFGTIAHKFPTEIYNNYPAIVDSLFNAINTNNIPLLPTALDTLGYVGATIEGKLSLGSLGRVFISALPQIGNYLKNSPTELRIRALNCVEYLIHVQADGNEEGAQIDQRVILMTREWFRELSEKPTSMEVIYNLCKNPFPELRINALKVLTAVVAYQWGEEIVKNTPGLVEFLLDRSVEHEKESKHIKYDIVTSLSKSILFDTNLLLRFKTYIKEGPFYVQGITEVAVEGD